jgi:hypothetical protein
MIMQKQLLMFILFFVSLGFTSCEEADTQTPEVVEVKESKMEKPEATQKLLRHLVIFKFNDESSEEDVARLNKSFNAVANAIPVVKDFEWGLNDSPENFHQDFTHCYLLTFYSEEARDSIYTPHPQHQAFVASLQDHVEKVFVVDYWTNPSSK